MVGNFREIVGCLSLFYFLYIFINLSLSSIVKSGEI